MIKSHKCYISIKSVGRSKIELRKSLSLLSKVNFYIQTSLDILPLRDLNIVFIQNVDWKAKNDLVIKEYFGVLNFRGRLKVTNECHREYLL